VGARSIATPAGRGGLGKARHKIGPHCNAGDHISARIVSAVDFGLHEASFRRLVQRRAEVPQRTQPPVIALNSIQSSFTAIVPVAHSNSGNGIGPDG